MLWTVFVVLLIMWLLGFFAFHIGGGLIHLVLVIAAIVLVVNLLTGRRATACASDHDLRANAEVHKERASNSGSGH